jgi:hypothetical protein
VGGLVLDAAGVDLNRQRGQQGESYETHVLASVETER